MVIQGDFQSENQKRELYKINSASFPYVCIESKVPEEVPGVMQWHWHDAFEVNYVTDGELIISTTTKDVRAEKGDLIFVNSGIVHRSRGKSRCDTRVCTHLFDMHFLSGMYGSVFEERYFEPVCSCSDIDVIRIRPSDMTTLNMVQSVIKAIEYARDDKTGYELAIRNYLSNFWLGLFEITEDIRKSASKKKNLDIVRAKKMMGFIQERFCEKITLNEIADSAGVSTRECTRCFVKTIGVSPIKYLGQYRIMMAAEMLDSSSLSISEIARETGFESSSYFAKVFNDTFGCSPKEYRNNTKQGA